MTSYREDGSPIYIEVKTTEYNNISGFSLIDLQIKFCKENIDNYYIYRLYNLKLDTGETDLVIIKGNGLIEKAHNIPTRFRIEF